MMGQHTMKWTNYFHLFKVFAVMGVVALAVCLLVALAEARLAHASETFTVTNTGDPGDGICGGGCTLREAITAANSTPGANTIKFNIPGSGPHTISPTSPLPEITERVTIDGYSQPGAFENTSPVGTNADPMIELSGQNAGQGADGLKVRASGSMVRGLIINCFEDRGVEVLGEGTTGVKIEGNFIGTDPSGTQDLGNRLGVVLNQGATSATVGGATSDKRNLISGNDGNGMSLFGPSTNNKIQGNLIGTKKDAAGALGNEGSGVVFSNDDASNNTVGGTIPGESNTIAFNTAHGVATFAPGSTGNRILRNSSFSNSLRGIALNSAGPIPNDPKDTDTGPNTLQNFPVLSSATTSSSEGKTTIKGTLNSRPGKTFKVQFFSNSPFSGAAEGQKFIGQKKVETNRKGNASFTFSLSEATQTGVNITATATGPGGNTSEFSAPIAVTAVS